MTLQTDIQTLLVPGIPRIPLSEIMDPDEAIQRLTESIIDIHRVKRYDGNPHPQVAIVGHDTEVLWNVLLNYYRGQAVDLISGDDYVTDENFVLPEFLVQELLGWLIDVDVSEKEVNKLPLDHPYWVIKDLLDIYQQKREHEISLYADKDEREKEPEIEHAGKYAQILEHESVALARCTALLATLVRNIYTQDDDIQRYRSDPKEIVGNIVILENGEKVAADYIFKKEHGIDRFGNETGYGRLVDQSLNYPAIDEDGEKKNARAHHQMMVRSATYLDKYESALENFATKPSKASRELIHRIQSHRPSLADSKRPKVTIVGLGPAGLLAAIRAYQRGAKVTCVEKRAVYTRNNTFRFTPIVMDEIFKLFVDSPQDIAKLPENHPLRMVIDKKIFGEKLPSPEWGPGWHEYSPITFRDFEYLLYSWIHLVQKQDPDGMRIFNNAAYVPESLKGREKSIEITTELGERKSIPTDFLVGSDGYHSQCRRDAGIGVYKMSTPASYATFNYHPQRGGEDEFFQSLLKPVKRKPADMPALKALGWEFDREPVPRFFNTGNHPYLGIEVPERLAREYKQLNEEMRKANNERNFQKVQQLKERQVKLMDEWGRVTIAMFLPEEEVERLVLKDFSIIDVQLQKSTTVTATLPSTMGVLLIGDAAQSAHFQTGSGAIFGMRGANDVGQFIKNIIAGQSVSEALKNFEKCGKRRGVALHEWAFGFPTKEDLRVKPTSDYYIHRREVRLEQIKETPTALKAESAQEAQVKAQAKTNIARRRR